jgi:hypothetical protein
MCHMRALSTYWDGSMPNQIAFRREGLIDPTETQVGSRIDTHLAGYIVLLYTAKKWKKPTYCTENLIVQGNINRFWVVAVRL